MKKKIAKIKQIIFKNSQRTPLLVERTKINKSEESEESESEELENDNQNCLTIRHLIAILIIVAITLGVVISRLYENKNATTYLGLGAIASNGEGCAEVGGKILEDGGTAIDAVIATLLCEGVMLPHSLGIGGGFVATIYKKHRESYNIECLIAREPAPQASSKDMFLHKKITGAIAAGIPSEIYGYGLLHDKYGKLPWKKLFEPSIQLCLNGHKVTRHLATVLKFNKQRIKEEPSMAEIFINPVTNEVYKEGDVIYRPKLGETLQIIAQQGPGAIYNGGIIGKKLIEDIQMMGGIITEEDLKNYRARWEDPIITNFTNHYKIYTPPLPTSGVVLAYILNVMSRLYTSNQNIYWQRLIETFKHAYGHRTNLGDVEYEPMIEEIYLKLISQEFADKTINLINDESTSTDINFYGGNFTLPNDNGTANTVVLAPNGDAIIVTSTINSHLGAKVRSRQTGIILNDEMDDFSTPGVINTYGIRASPSNYIRPGKIPMSSMCPCIVLDRFGEIILMVGGAGGSKITTAVAQTILRYLILDQSLEDAINAGRIHHQLLPMQIDVEQNVPFSLNQFFINIGHQLNYLPPDKTFSALTAIGLKQGLPNPICDARRQGSTKIVISSNI